MYVYTEKKRGVNKAPVALWLLTFISSLHISVAPEFLYIISFMIKSILDIYKNNFKKLIVLWAEFFIINTSAFTCFVLLAPPPPPGLVKPVGQE